MDVGRELLGLLVGFAIATVTTPVGVSGAVFLLPVQLSAFQVPNPQVTPTNLLYNVVSGPGGLLRYATHGTAGSALARWLVLGSVPGVVLGAVLRVHVVDGPEVFRLAAAGVLLPTGLLVLWGTRGREVRTRAWVGRRDLVVALAFAVGVVGGVYGIGGGSLLGPLLVGAGLSVRTVAPAALLATFAASVVGVVVFGVLALGTAGTVAPDWSLGLATGLGGLLGGYVGARLQPRLPERGLRGLLGVLAVALAAVYAVRALI